MKNVYKYLFDSLSENKKEVKLIVAKGIFFIKLLNRYLAKFFRKTFPHYERNNQIYRCNISKSNLKSLSEKAQEINISRDTWYMIWEFNKIIGTDLDKYDYKNGTYVII